MSGRDFIAHGSNHYFRGWWMKMSAPCSAIAEKYSLFAVGHYVPYGICRADAFSRVSPLDGQTLVIIVFAHNVCRWALDYEVNAIGLLAGG